VKRTLSRVAKKFNNQALEAGALHSTTDIWSSGVVLLGPVCVAVSDMLPRAAFLKAFDAVAAPGVARCGRPDMPGKPAVMNIGRAFSGRRISDMKRKFQNAAAFVEFLAGSGLAIFFHLVLHHPQVAYFIFGVSILASIGTYLLRDDIEKTKETLLDQYEKAHETTFMMAQIADPECQAKAHKVMAAAKRTLSLLRHGRIPLDESEFYLEAAKCCDQAMHHIKAVNPLNAGWTTRGALLNLYQANLRALERRVKITRIFVVDHEELSNPAAQKLLLTQFRDNIDIRIAYRDELPSAHDLSDQENISSFDFTIYDDRTITNLAAQSAKYFGTKTREASHVEKYLRLFDLIGHVAHAVVEQDEKIIPATMVTDGPSRE
jgi:hypothetical protein